MENSLEEIRKKINETDSEIVKLFEKRMRLSSSVAEYKRQSGKAVYDPVREKEIIKRLSSVTDEEFSQYIAPLYSTVFNLSRSYQTMKLSSFCREAQNMLDALESTPKLFPRKADAACQGVEGAYSHAACEKLFNSGNITFFKTWEQVCKAVLDGRCEYGVLPLENSTAGTVNEVYDLLGRYNLYIVRSVKLKINHSLLCKKGTKLTDITEIVSHEQAIRQCSDFLSRAGVKVTAFENTAAAAKYVSESDRTDIAAIGSAECANIYNLSVTDENIMNSDNNYTRFICISKNLEIYPGAHRTSIVFTLPHRSGSLSDVLSVFRAYDINLTKLESRPIAGRDFEFRFFADLDASVYREELPCLITQLFSELDCVGYLGTYTEIF